MKFRSCDCKRVRLPIDGSRWTRLLSSGEGSFAFGRQNYGEGVCDVIWLRMPYDSPHKAIHTLRIYRDGEPKPKDPAWLWDGVKGKPTLSPSIACGMPSGSDWHGYLKAGRLEGCE